MKTKLLLLTVFAVFFHFSVSAVNIIIIKTPPNLTLRVQDTIWKNLAQSMGYNATIDSANVLDDTSFFATTDILIVSEADEAITDTELQNIIAFVKRGKPAYIQSEYLPTFQGNITFQAIMDSIDADFRWGSSVVGDLEPMEILPPFSTTPYQTDSIDYFNYGLTGIGYGVDSFLEYQGQFFGFYYNQSNPKYGRVVTISDEDWVWQNDNPLLMKNILYYLAYSTAGINTISNNRLPVTIYPNPCNGNFSVETSNTAETKWILFDVFGRQLSSGVLSAPKTNFDLSYLPEGNYMLNIYSADAVTNRQIEIVK